uniref:Uncharacterized protein n=1 Tax=Avena sativa TaxID=4498 RepID=A0ACD5WFP8_AVESA
MESKVPPLAPTGGRKRKGRPIPPVAQVTGWASLPDDIARPVTELLLKCDVVDYTAFRAVCSGWRACAPIPRDPTLTSRSLRPVDWIPLCDGDAVRPDDACQITFFNCKTARSLRVHLPQLQRHRIVGFTDGLLILLHKRRTTVRVLHPFTGVSVDFPPLFPDNPDGVLRVNAAVCASVSSTTSIAVVAWFPWRPVVVSADAGHQSWEVIHNSMDLLNTLPFQGRLYGFLKLSTQIVQVYPLQPQPPGAVAAQVPRKFGHPNFVVAQVPLKCGKPHLCNYYLVESDGHMLLVVKSSNAVGSDVEEWQRYTFAIFKVDAGLRRWKLSQMSSLGDRALFICMDRCLSVSAKDLPSISSDSLYLTVPLPDPVVVYNLSRGSFERPTTLCQVHNGKERIRPSVQPFALADHLLTYCNHREWTNGLMFHEYYFIPESFEELWKKIRTRDSEVGISRVKD